MILSCVLFLVSFGWFAAHAVPSVYFGDNGELLAAIHTGGIPHPTGFPLFILLSTLPSHYGTLAVNLVSSACGALAVVWIARTAHSLFGRAASVPAAVVLLGSCTLTLQAASARVYTCQLAAMAAVMLVAASFKPERRWGLLFGFLLGLSAGTHVLFLGGLVFTAVLLLDRRREIIPLVPWIAGALMIGASVLLWIPLRSSLQPVINWGEPSHGSRWWLYITQSSYRSKMFSRGFDGTGLFLREFLRILRFEWNPVVWLLFLPGWGTLLFAKNRRFAYALGLTALFYLALLYSYGGEYDLNVLDRYFLPLTALAALWVGNGWVWLWERWIPGRWRGLRIQIVALAALAVLFLSAPAKRWQDLQLSSSSWSYALDLLKSVPRNAVLEVAGDLQVFPSAFAWHVRGLRPDVVRVDWNESVFPEWARRLRTTPGLTRTALEKELFDLGGGQRFIPERISAAPPWTCLDWGMTYRLANVPPSVKIGPPPYTTLRMKFTRSETNDTEGQDTAALFLLHRAAWYDGLGRRPEAVEDLQTLERTCPRAANALVDAAVAYDRMGMGGSIEPLLLRALELRPHHFTANLNLGMFYASRGLLSLARRHLQTALQAVPRDPLATQWLQRVESLMAEQL